jgi:subfamily B ATP-binding cassette protein MsbA
MKSLLKLKPYLAPFWGLILISALLALPLAALRAAPAPLVKFLFDDVLANRDEQKLMWFPAIFIGLYVVNFVVRFFHYYCLRLVVARVNQRLKNDLFEHLLGLSADHFSSQRVGTLISRVASDPQHVDGGLSAINVLLREPITFLMLFGYALYLNWQLTLVMLLIFPPMAWVFAVTGRNLKRYVTRMQEENALLFSALQESFTGIRVVKMFRLEKYVRKKFRERSDRFRFFLEKTARLEEAAHPMIELITAFAIAAVIWYGGRSVLRGDMQQGELLAFFAAFGMMMNPIRMLNDINIKLNTAAGGATRIFELLSWKTNLVERPNPQPLKALEREIEFKDVRFSYPDAPERAILGGVSFKLQKGCTIALVGGSGGGKSSLVNLLPRVFDVTGGSIEIDGVDVRDLSLEDLRARIAVVTQDVFLFNDTVEENIRCGRLSATREEILEAARRAHATDFIDKLADGMQSQIGDRGQKLSGGEKQRLSIARAFLRNAPILILDEATSSLDNQSERIVQSALEELMKDKTTIVIAHRLSTVRNADEILVIQAGQIVERGTHAELTLKQGEYFKLSQLSDHVVS